MSYGTWTAVLWAASFLCSMYAQEAPLIGALSTPLAFISIYYITRQIGCGAKQTNLTSFFRILNITVWSYFFCAIFTTFVQAIYFVGLDGGRFASMLQQTLSMINMSQFPSDMCEQMQIVIDIFADPQTATRMMLTQNLFLGFILSFFTAPVVYFIQLRKKQ